MTMNRLARAGAAIVATLLLAPAVALAVLPPEMSDLVKVKSKRLAEVHLLPGTDFSAYRKVMIDPAQVSFNKNWVKESRSAGLTSRRIPDEQLKAISEAARSGFGEIFQEAFKRAGYEVVTAAGPDVVRLTPAIINLYINAPSGSSATRTYAMNAGEATLAIAVRDSMSGALLGMALDKRETRTAMAGPVLADSVTNRAEFEVLFRRWADIAAKGFTDMRESPPVPTRKK
jgi:hypothetical protein